MNVLLGAFAAIFALGILAEKDMTAKRMFFGSFIVTLIAIMFNMFILNVA